MWNFEVFPQWRSGNQFPHVWAEDSVGLRYQPPGVLGWLQVQTAQPRVQEHRADGLQRPPDIKTIYIRARNLDRRSLVAINYCCYSCVANSFLNSVEDKLCRHLY